MREDARRSRETLAAALAIDMRTPLARVELAASQIGREATTPMVRALGRSVSEAVEEVDRLIARMLKLLAPPVATREVEVPLEDVLDGGLDNWLSGSRSDKRPGESVRSPLPSAFPNPVRP